MKSSQINSQPQKLSYTNYNVRMPYIVADDSHQFIQTLPDDSIDLLLFDPPYAGIVKDSWDNQWKDNEAYVAWFMDFLRLAKPKMKEHGSVIFFGGLGKHNDRPFFKTLLAIESENLYRYRNIITWAKRRAYGKTHDYLFTREEIAWYSVSPDRTNVRFNIPLLNVKRGYPGYNKKYPAKSDFKRVTNVWSDITELFKTDRACQKPMALMKRLIETHSNLGDLVVDPFAGYGTTGIVALGLGRDFLGCERIEQDALEANDRCVKTMFKHNPVPDIVIIGDETISTP